MGEWGDRIKSFPKVHADREYQLPYLNVKPYQLPYYNVRTLLSVRIYQ